MSGLKFILEMVDKMSGPAGQAVRAVKRLEKSLQGVASIRLPEPKMPALKADRAGVVGGAKGLGNGPTAAIDKEWSKIAAAEEVGRQKKLAASEKALAKQQALEERAALKQTALEEKQRSNAEKALAKQQAAEEKAAGKAAAVAAKQAAKQQPHEDAKMLPMLAGMPKLQLAVGQLDELKTKLRDDKLAVTNLTASLRQMEAATVVDIGAVRLLKAELQGKKNALAETQKTLVLSGNAAKFGSEGTNRLTTTLRALAEAAGGKGITGLAGRLASAAAGSKGLGETFSKFAIGPETHELAVSMGEIAGVGPGAAAAMAGLGLAAVGAVAGILALGAAMGALVLKGAALAIEANDAKGDTIDMLNAMLGSAEAADDVYGSIVDLTRDTTLTISKGQALAQSLSAAGLTNVALMKDALASIATVDSVLKGGGDKIQAIIEKATTAGKFDVNAKKLAGTGVQMQALYEEISARTGIGVKGMEKQLAAGKVSAEVGIAALTKVIDKKLGAVARKQAHDLPVQFARLKDNIGRLFEDVNTGPFLEAFSRLVDLFDSSSRSGKILKGVFEDVFDGLFKVATKTIDYVETLLLGMLVIGLEVAVGLQPLLIALGLIGDESEASQPGMDSFVDGLLLIGETAGIVAGWIGNLGNYLGTLEALGAAFALITLPIWGLPALLLAGAAAFTYLIATIGEAISAFDYLFDQGMQWGQGVVDGIVDGIAGAAGKLVNAVKDLSGRAKAAWSDFWQQRSPSKVGIALGKNLGFSVASGLGKAREPANDNMRKLVAIPSGVGPASTLGGTSPEMRLQQQAGARPGGKGGGTTINITIESIVIQGGASGVEASREQMVEFFAGVIEEAALKAGLDPTGTG